jgi:PAS domain S-box-containing protein
VTERITRSSTSEADRYARSLIEKSVNPLVATNRQGKITDVNAAAEDATGIPRDQLLGTDFADCFREPEEARAAFKRVLEEGLLSEYPLALRHVSGRLTPVEYNATVYRDESGELQAVFAAARDTAEAQEARRQVARLALIAASSQYAVFSRDLAGVITGWNAAAEALYGYAAAEAIGCNGKILMPPGREGETQEIIKRMLRGDRGFGFETQRLHKDGSLVDVAFTLSPIRDAAGDIMALSITDHDISERVRAERELRESEAKFAAAFHASPDLMDISRLSDGKLLEINEGFTQLLGYARAEVIGKTTSELGIRADSGDRGCLVAALEGAGQASELETTLRRKDGSLITGIESAGTFELQSETCVLSVFHDITERKRAEVALRESEARYRSLFEDSPIAMWEDDHSAVKLHLEELNAGGVDDVIAFVLADPQEYARCVELVRVVDANNAAVRLFDAESREELLARNCDLYRDESEPGIWQLWQAMLAGERSVTFEEADRTLTGKDIEVLETCTVVPGHEQTYDRVYLADVDISERRLAARELVRHAEQLQRTVEGAVLAMSHMVESRDPYTAGHERRVAELATAIGAEMGMAGEELDALRLASTIHDIGKIAVPAEILAKPGRLSELEFSLIQVHPTTGFEILSDVDFGFPVAELVLQHHERLDGSGYPRGLKGEEIMAEARILAVADVVEAMASHRPYRAALPLEDALAEIEAGAGIRYDARVCEAAIRLFREQGFAFSEER